MAIVTSNASPLDLLSRFRGRIIHAAPGYPEVIHLTARDGDGGEWSFSTFYAQYAPSDPAFFTGKTIIDTILDPAGKLTITFSDTSAFTVSPIPLQPDEPDDELETWHLLTPDGLSLWYGPWGRWRLRRGGDPR